jgi:hypothetical protein
VREAHWRCFDVADLPTEQEEQQGADQQARTEAWPNYTIEHGNQSCTSHPSGATLYGWSAPVANQRMLF